MKRRMNNRLAFEDARLLELMRIRRLTMEFKWAMLRAEWERGK